MGIMTKTKGEYQMPQKMSIEVVKHSDNDFRLIYKSENFILRKTFDSVDDLTRCIFFQVMGSSVLKNTTFRIRFGR